jgi:hypothetical protein
MPLWISVSLGIVFDASTLNSSRCTSYAGRLPSDSGSRKNFTASIRPESGSKAALRIWCRLKTATTSGSSFSFCVATWPALRASLSCMAASIIFLRMSSIVWSINFSS